MSNNEKHLSDYIDRLNMEKKPLEHEADVGSDELEAIFETVRKVRSLKEPSMPESDYPKRLAGTVAGQLGAKRRSHFKKTYIAGAAAAAVLILAIMINIISPFGGSNIVYAMENAFKGVKAYHGLLELAETNAAGETLIQSSFEIWADKEGRYVVKQLEGSGKGLVTANNGERKWQLRPDQKQAFIFAAFPDSYRFIFELGKEIDHARNALTTRVIGEEEVWGRRAYVLEISPPGGAAYHIWIDRETKLPLQKQSAMQNALQYSAAFTRLELIDAIPTELLAYELPEGFEEVAENPEQIVAGFEEAQSLVSFVPAVLENMPEGYRQSRIVVELKGQAVRTEFVADNNKRVFVLQGKAAEKLQPASRAILGKVNNSTAEIQESVQEGLGVLAGGAYAGYTDISSIRWQQDGFEYAVVGNISPEEIAVFIKALTKGRVELPSRDEELSANAKVKVPVNIEIEQSEQKSVDAGHTPWKLDPVFTAQVFVSLQISPEGIIGEYPVQTEELKLTQSTYNEAVVEIGRDNTPVRRVYLKRLVRQDSTGIWTVVGYDPADGN